MYRKLKRNKNISTTANIDFNNNFKKNLPFGPPCVPSLSPIHPCNNAIGVVLFVNKYLSLLFISHFPKSIERANWRPRLHPHHKKIETKRISHYIYITQGENKHSEDNIIIKEKKGKNTLPSFLLLLSSPRFNGYFLNH